MKSFLVLLATATILLQSGCVTGRRTLTLDVPTTQATTATKGKVYIESITDHREFQNKPSDPSIPSVDGDVTMLSPAGKDRMIGRQRGGFGKAMGDISLSDNDTVTSRVRQLVEEGWRRAGYEISASPAGATPLTVSVDQFWAWMNPGFWSLTFEARINTRITLKAASGNSSFVVLGTGTNQGQFAKDGNWQEAYGPAFVDYLANFKRETAALQLP